jgi:hypothetical protein
MDDCPVVHEGRTLARQIRENTFLNADIDELRNGLKSEIPELLIVAAENLAWIIRESECIPNTVER